MANLFNKKVLSKHLAKHSIPEEKEKIDRITKWKENLELNQGVNEEQLQGAFLKGIFGLILGYKDTTEAEDKQYTMKAEPATEVDASKPDGSLGFFEINGVEQTKAVIELKGPKISLDKKQKRSGKDYGTPVEQAFNYATKYDGCNWIIVSNMIEIRLYKYTRGQGHYEEFRIPELNQPDEFKKFHFLLSRENLINKHQDSLTWQLTEETTKREEDISTEFYNLYKQIRIDLFEHLKENNPNYDQELLLEKAQKFLDRIIFICFCEDKGLLPNTLLHEAIQRAKGSYSMSPTKVWQEIKGVFRSVDKGNPEHNINGYNGTLFKYDDILDDLIIKNEFFDNIYEISDYDFDSDLDVNILGHIFEQSITDIEELKADIREDEYDEKESRRKKDGIYYTPKYITKYIVENSIGSYLDDIRKKLGYYELPELESASTPQVEGKYKKQHLEFYEKYEEVLKDIKVLDPACGSGAFLNQAFDYLLQEHQWIQKQREFLQHEHGQRSIFGLPSLQKEILKNNIYGVDLNEESVEITKLSLWLKTANKNKPLTNLDDNIKCGNSLIEDPEIAGDKAFNWGKEFLDEMSEKMYVFETEDSELNAITTEEGGFDVIIGNPPYVDIKDLDTEITEYFLENFETAINRINLYSIFIERSLELLKPTGYLSFIIPNSLLVNSSYKKIRKKLVEGITGIVKLPNEVFANLNVNTIIFCFQKNVFHEKSNIHIINNASLEKINDVLTSPPKSISKENWLKDEANNFNIYTTDEVINIIDKCYADTVPFKEVCDFSLGITPYDKYKGHSEEVIDNREFHSPNKHSEEYKPLIKGGNILRYFIKPKIKEYIKYGEWLGAPREQRFFEKPRVIVRQIISGNPARIYSAYTDKSLYFAQIGFGLIPNEEEIDPRYIAALLNSKLITFIHRYKFLDIYKDVFQKILIAECKELPFKYPEAYQQSTLVKKVSEIRDFKKQIYDQKQEDFSNFINRYCSSLGIPLEEIMNQEFCNEIYSGRARKVREMTVNINDKIITLYSDKSSSGQYELFKFQVNDKYKRRYIKYYLENLTNEQLEEINEFSGSLPKRVKQIEIPDFDKYNVVRKVVNEWQGLQQEIAGLESKIEKADQEIDQLVYDLYNLTEEEIKVVEESLE
ncbi:Eco57I restriction-modification methylase domain-containing protein [Fuchsiella alkaliacetigena]|uniref:Eco57I restriction-modification methylase domain-containing protein n=1 Tax=Fuchsiella alkaliacetigena TaxID=957042 RepID=UPI00200B42C9|nr:N-6 DNA methylase [Fuchsiella alkaliacetigena]MCK8824675.1 BREX-1 system adenine-specific DNA-methyltransferase PglX [Fuchsiella alkaliacetigena]